MRELSTGVKSKKGKKGRRDGGRERGESSGSYVPGPSISAWISAMLSQLFCMSRMPVFGESVV
jgi:hypothetical protein